MFANIRKSWQEKEDTAEGLMNNHLKHDQFAAGKQNRFLTVIFTADLQIC
jgi:hypothetical protein